MKILLAIFCGIVLLNVEAFGDWKNITPPGEGANVPPVNCLNVFNGSLIAGTEEGIFLSGDGGAHWELANAGLVAMWSAKTSVYSIAFVGAAIFAGTDNGLMRSVDGGHHWLRVDSGWTYPNSSNSVFTIAHVVENNGSLYAADQSTGIFRSMDGGTTWTQLIDTLHQGLLSALIPWGTSLLEILDGQQLLISHDNAEHWYPIASPTQAFYSIGINCCFAEGDTLWVGTPFFNNYFRVGVWFSVDTGKTWTCVDSVFGNNESVAVVASAGGIFFAQSEYRSDNSQPPNTEMRRSSDHGRTWSNCMWSNDTSINNHQHVGNIIAIGDNLVAATSLGFYRSSDRGETWSRSSSGATSVRQSTLFAFDHALLAGTPGEYFLSTDDGELWTNGITPFYGSFLVNSFSKTSSSVFAAAYQPFYTEYPAIFVSEDSGRNWSASRLPAGGLVSNDIIVLTQRNDTVWASAKQKSFRKAKGSNERVVVGNVPTQVPFYGMSTAIAAGASNIVVGTDGGLYTSTDGSDEWNADMYNEIYGMVNCLIYTSHTFFVGDNDGHFNKSTDDGLLWYPVNQWLNYGVVYALSGMNDLVFAAASNGIFCSTDAGNNWQNISGDLTGGEFTSIQVSAKYVYVSTPTNIWRRSLSDFGITGVTRQTPPISPTEISMQQNFPNPFSQITSISFTITNDEPIQLSIIDDLGIEVASMMKGFVNAGMHTVEFDGHGLRSGHYVVRLVSPHGMTSKEMTILRR